MVPPNGFPAWLWAALSVLLPVLYQSFLGRFPGWLKFILCWGISAIIVVVVGFVSLHYTSPAQFLVAFAWLVASIQAVYSLLVKPIARQIAPPVPRR